MKVGLAQVLTICGIAAVGAIAYVLLVAKSGIPLITGKNNVVVPDGVSTTASAVCENNPDVSMISLLSEPDWALPQVPVAIYICGQTTSDFAITAGQYIWVQATADSTLTL